MLAERAHQTNCIIRVSVLVPARTLEHPIPGLALPSTTERERTKIASAVTQAYVQVAERAVLPRLLIRRTGMTYQPWPWKVVTRDREKEKESWARDDSAEAMLDRVP